MDEQTLSVGRLIRRHTGMTISDKLSDRCDRHKLRKLGRFSFAAPVRTVHYKLRLSGVRLSFRMSLRMRQMKVRWGGQLADPERQFKAGR